MNSSNSGHTVFHWRHENICVQESFYPTYKITKTLTVTIQQPFLRMIESDWMDKS